MIVLILSALLVVLLLSALTTAWLTSLRRAKNSARPVLAPVDRDADPELRRLATGMARLLDQGLTDPMLRQTQTWEQRAAVLVDEFYGTRGLRSTQQEELGH